MNIELTLSEEQADLLEDVLDREYKAIGRSVSWTPANAVFANVLGELRRARRQAALEQAVEVATKRLLDALLEAVKEKPLPKGVGRAATELRSALIDKGAY